MADRKNKENKAQKAVCGTLSPEQYRIMRQNGTEPPFNNKYWDNKEAGIYVDAISGEPLLAHPPSLNSGSGWPELYPPD